MKNLRVYWECIQNWDKIIGKQRQVNPISIFDVLRICSKIFIIFLDGLPKEWSLFLVYIYLCNTCWISVLQFSPVYQYWCRCGSSSWSIHLSAQIAAKVQSQWRKSSREFSAAKCPGINTRSCSLIKSLKILFVPIVQQST